jgi:hypothetical protein
MVGNGDAALLVERDIDDAAGLSGGEIGAAGVAAIGGSLPRGRASAGDVAIQHRQEALGIGGIAALNNDIEDQAAFAATVTPKPLKELTIVGHSVPRRDIPAKVTGGAAYVQDVRLDGMVHGRVVRPPRYGARLDNIDETAARAVPGVVAVVRDGSFLGVVTEREEQAIKARYALIRAATWSGGSELPDL